MGIVYCGPYADAIGYDAHEGYAARILPDGTETGTWTWETREFRGYRARCGCGWRGAEAYPATEAGQRGAEDEWDHDHLRPLIRAEAARHTIPADVLLGSLDELRESLTCTVDAGGERLTERSRGVCDAIAHLEHLLDDRAQAPRRGVPADRRRPHYPREWKHPLLWPLIVKYHELRQRRA